MAPRTLKTISTSKITIFKIRNRSGYAALCLQNLTEGRTAAQAYSRLMHPLKRMGYQLNGKVPKPKR